jgi:hypothetical protein
MGSRRALADVVAGGDEHRAVDVEAVVHRGEAPLLALEIRVGVVLGVERPREERAARERELLACLKNDFVFRRILATQPDILRGLLNDLPDRRGDATIDVIEYLPRSELPLMEGAKLSILDVRCRDRAGTTFVVEMQLIHHPGFVAASSATRARPTSARRLRRQDRRRRAHLRRPEPPHGPHATQ